MSITIKHRYTDKVLFEYAGNSMADAVHKAVDAEVDLSGANLCRANLSEKFLYGAKLNEADLYSANLTGTYLGKADLSKADLGLARLDCADLKGANLSGACVCYSRGWTFSCKHSRFKVDASFARQVLAHLCSCTSDDPEFEAIKELILPEAKKSHRAHDLGLIKFYEELS